MKGFILTEFIEFTADELGVGEARRILAAAPSGRLASFDAIATYDDAELFSLVERVVAATGEPQSALLARFGARLFAHFYQLYPVFFFEVDSALDFMGGIETNIHAEVQKLYPDASFPHFECSRPAADRLEMVYRSSRPLADLAEGLIRGCIAHFGEPIEVRREDLSGGASGPGCAARFSLTLG